MYLLCLPCVNASRWKCPHKKIATEYNVQDAGHQQLDKLGSVNNIAADSSTKHFLRNFFVTSAYPDQLTIFLFIKAFDQNFASVTTDMSKANHRCDTPISPMKNSKWQRYNEHALNE